MLAKGNNKYPIYNQIDVGDFPPISMNDFVNSLMESGAYKASSLKSAMSESLPISNNAAQPIQNTQESDLLSKIKSLEPQFTKTPTDIKPTGLMDVINSISNVIGGGTPTKEGEKDFLGGVMNTLDKIGGYASSGQGTSILGALTGNRNMIDAGLNKLSQENMYQQKNDENKLNSAKNALDYYRTVGEFSGEKNRGQYLAPFTYYDESRGVYRKGSYDSTAKDPSLAYIKSDNDPIVRNEEVYTGTDPNTGQVFSYGKSSGKKTEITQNTGPFTLPQKEALSFKGKNIISNQVKSFDALGSFKNAKNLVNSDHGLVSLQNMLSTAAGDPGNKSVADREGITGPNAIISKFRNYASMAVNGKLPPEGQAYVLDLISKYEDSYYNKIRAEIEINKNDFLSLYPEADKSAVDKYFDGLVSNQVKALGAKNKTDNKKSAPTSNPKNAGTTPVSTGQSKNATNSRTYTSKSGKTYTLSNPGSK